MSLSSPVVVPVSATRSIQREYTARPSRSTTIGTSVPAHSSPISDTTSSLHVRSPSQPTNSSRVSQPIAASRHNGGSRTQPNSPTSATAAGRPRAIDLAALPSFSHSLSEFASMGIVPGDILSGCLRTGTAQVCKEKLDNVLAANNKVLGPYSSSSEDEFSSYSSDSHYPTIRRRPFPGLTPIHPVSPTSPSRPAFTHQPSSSTSNSSQSSTASHVPPLTSTSYKRNTSLTIDARTANAILDSQSSRGTNKYRSNDTHGLSSPPALMESRSCASDSSPGALPTPYNGTDQASAQAAAANYFPPTSASKGRNAHGSDSDSDAAALPGTTSNAGTIRLNRRISGKATSIVWSTSRTPRAQRSPERDKATAGAPSVPLLSVSIGSPVSGQQGPREREAAMFRSALERVQRKGSVRRVRPHARATFELSSESESDEE